MARTGSAQPQPLRVDPIKQVEEHRCPADRCRPGDLDPSGGAVRWAGRQQARQLPPPFLPSESGACAPHVARTPLPRPTRQYVDLRIHVVDGALGARPSAVFMCMRHVAGGCVASRTDATELRAPGSVLLQVAQVMEHAGRVQRLVHLSEVLAALFARPRSDRGAAPWPRRAQLRDRHAHRRRGRPAAPTQRSALFYALLMKDPGCSSNASRLRRSSPPTITISRRDVKRIDWSQPIESFRFVAKHRAGQLLAPRCARSPSWRAGPSGRAPSSEPGASAAPRSPA